MTVKDEVIFLLHTAAEIEHSLLSQYLYSMYSLTNGPMQNQWRSTLMQIAREEMGHLMCVQNILLALGGPINFEREDYPFNALYPFPFRLEPLTVQSLARYVLAEMPERQQITAPADFNLDAISQDAGFPSAEANVNRVGALFDLLAELVAELGDKDLVAQTTDLQADSGSWRAPQHSLVLDRVSSVQDISRLVTAIGTQGEGPGMPTDPNTSHFVRFYKMYLEALEFRSTSHGGSMSHLVPIDPTVHDPLAQGYISNPEARAWADVFNHRMRWLLSNLSDYFVMNDTTQRNHLRNWAFEEMRFVDQIAEKLVSLPLHSPAMKSPEGRLLCAGPTFELPYTLNPPGHAVSAWRIQETLARHALDQLKHLPNTEPIVFFLRDASEQRLKVIDGILSPVTS